MADALLGGIVINEVLVDPNGSNNFDTDGNGTAASTDEYVELYNSSASAIDISGLELWDSGAGNWFTFPPGTVLQPGAHALVITGVQSGGSLPTGGPDDLFFDAGRGSAVINNGGDNITVYDPANDEFIQAVFNGDSFDDPTLAAGGYTGFSSTATQAGTGEDFGNDVDGQSLQRQGDGADTFTSDTPTPGISNVCFTDGTHIQTPTGPRLAEELRVGDSVSTLSNGDQPIRWVFHKTWTAQDMARHINLAPVRIRAGALGVGVPSRDLCVSRQHRILVRGPIAKRMFGTAEVLIPAKSLLSLPGVSVDTPENSVTFIHIMLAQHDILLSDGAASESMFIGSQALRSVPANALNGLAETLGLTVSDLIKTAPFQHPARLLVDGKKAKRLIERHMRNGRELSDNIL